MPEQSVHRQENPDADQQIYQQKIEGEAYENNRQYRSGRIQRRN